MAKSRVKTVTVEVPETGPDEVEEHRQTAAETAAEYAREAAGLDDDDAADLLSALEELRTTQGVLFQIYRTEPTDKEGFCTEYPAAVFSQMRLAKDYGPGTYRVRIKGPGGKYIPGGGSLKITPTAETFEPTGESSSVQDMLAILKSDKEASSAKLKEWAVILAPLLAPVIQSWVTPKNQVTDLVNGLAALQGLQPKPKEAPDFNSQLDNIAQLMGKLKELAGDDKTPTGSTWIDLIRDGINGVKPVLEQLATRALSGPARTGMPTMIPAPVSLPGPLTSSSPPPGSAPSPGTTSPAPGAENVSANERQPVGVISLLPWLSATLQQLVHQASRSKDPAFYADVVFDNIPDGIDVKQLEPFLRRADWWAQLQTFAPQVSPYPAWFEDFRDALLDLIAEEKPPGDPPPPPAPNGGEEPQPMARDELDPGDGM